MSSQHSCLLSLLLKECLNLAPRQAKQSISNYRLVVWKDSPGPVTSGEQENETPNRLTSSTRSESVDDAVVSDGIVGFLPSGERLVHYKDGPGMGRHAGYSYRAAFLAVHAGSLGLS